MRFPEYLPSPPIVASGAAGEKLRKATSTLHKLGTMEHYCNQLHVREELEGKCKRKTATSNILDPIADSGSGELLFPLPLSPVDPELTRCSSKLDLSPRILSLRFTNLQSHDVPRLVMSQHVTSDQDIQPLSLGCGICVALRTPIRLE